MVRHFVKGGVWKNSEDEILKAAVMKYGKQQWARVASLLNRKSAKQCKARWNEWLDPSVKKVEWSREEDEKLLHLAKLMPAQWRTVGPLVGRTANQCQERYERLLDEAAAGDGIADGAPGEAAGAGGARRLRPGEIDTHPETKPARPDPIDMDEDEIEMLQEARARLANTQGKKAKRKAREKMLAEAKRLADLQKRRELKQAGLLSGMMRTKARGGKKRRREIDFGVEIPFHKPAPAGFHATDAEDQRAEEEKSRRLRDVDYKRINEAQYRSRDREAKQAQKKEEARLRNLERSNMQYVVAEVSKRNDPLAARKRGELQMPEPAVTDEELGRVARLTSGAAAGTSTNTSGGATDALLGDYTDRPLPTPMRTPALGPGGEGKMSSQEIIMREASNLRLLERGQTPLLGGENAPLREGGAGTGIGLQMDVPSGAAAAAHDAATPMIGGDNGASASGGKTPRTLGPRDELGLNRPGSMIRPASLGSEGAAAYDDAASVGGTSFATSAAGGSMSIREIAREERRAAKRARRELEAALAALPAPQFEYELAAPEVPSNEDGGEEGAAAKARSAYASQRDAADVEAEEIEMRRREAANSYEERSTVVKRPELPRPVGAVRREAVFGSGADASSKDDPHDRADALIREEMLDLLQHDAFVHPFVAIDHVDEGGKKKSKKKDKKKHRKGKAAESDDIAAATSVPPPERPLDYISKEKLNEAKSLLKEETNVVLVEKAKELREADKDTGVMSDEMLQETLARRNASVSREGASSQRYIDRNNRHGWEAGVTDPEDDVSALRIEYDTLKEVADATKKRADKLEARITIKNSGYAKRAAALQESASECFEELQHARIEEAVYSLLRSHETRGAANRIEKLEQEIAALEATEAAAQKEYGELLHRKNRLLAKMR